MSRVKKSNIACSISVPLLVILFFLVIGCKKSSTTPTPPPPPNPPAGTTFTVSTHTINSVTFNSTGTLYGITIKPVIQISFSDKVDKSSVSSAISYNNKSQSLADVAYNVSYQNSDSTILVSPSADLNPLNEYIFSLTTLLKSASGKNLINRIDLDFYTQIDSTDKFPQISDSALLDLVQSQTFKYFWDFGHPVCGMARERNTSGDIVTTGGTGFGIMAIPAAINRNFITRTEGVARVQKIVSFLTNNAQRFHGAFSHWMNGTTEL
jgi:hypothetical protein